VDERALPSAGLPTEFGGAAAAWGPPRHELVVIDPGVPEAATLVHDLRLQAAAGRSIQVLLLQSNRDGLDQVSRALETSRPLDAIHVVTHGNPHGIQLGTTWLDARVVTDRAEAVARWSAALKPGADMLLYGCDLAAGRDGRHLLEALRALTGADVAASLNRTGAGGDWHLEITRGAVTAPPPFSADRQATFSGAFALFQAASTTGGSAFALTGGRLVDSPSSPVFGAVRWVAVGQTGNGFRISAPSALAIRTAGTQDIEVVLLNKPAAPVTVRIVGDPAVVITADPSTVTIFPENWSTPRPVRLRAMTTPAEDPSAAAIVVITIAYGDRDYDALSAVLPVRVVPASGSPADPLVYAVPPVTMTIAADDSGEFLVGEVVAEFPSNAAVQLTQPLRLPNGSGSTEGEGDDGDPEGAVASDAVPVSAKPNAQPAAREAAAPHRPGAAALPAVTSLAERRAALTGAATANPSRQLGLDLVDAERRQSARSRAAVGAAALASLGFVIWSLRGATRLGQVLTTPAQTWIALDPLVLLARRRSHRDDGDSLAGGVRT